MEWKWALSLVPIPYCFPDISLPKLVSIMICRWTEGRAQDHCEDLSVISPAILLTLGLHLWLMLVFTWYIWRAGTPITANTTNKGAHHGLLWCPAPLSNTAGLRKSVQKEEARACTCPLNPFKWYFTDKPKSAIHLVLTCGKCSSQTLPKLSLMLKDWQKIYNSGKKSFPLGKDNFKRRMGLSWFTFPCSLDLRFKTSLWSLAVYSYTATLWRIGVKFSISFFFIFKPYFWSLFSYYHYTINVHFCGYSDHLSSVQVIGASCSILTAVHGNYWYLNRIPFSVLEQSLKCIHFKLLFRFTIQLHLLVNLNWI